MPNNRKRKSTAAHNHPQQQGEPNAASLSQNLQQSQSPPQQPQQQIQPQPSPRWQVTHSHSQPLHHFVQRQNHRHSHFVPQLRQLNSLPSIRRVNLHTMTAAANATQQSTSAQASAQSGHHENGRHGSISNSQVTDEDRLMQMQLIPIYALPQLPHLTPPLASRSINSDAAPVTPRRRLTLQQSQTASDNTVAQSAARDSDADVKMTDVANHSEPAQTQQTRQASVLTTSSTIASSLSSGASAVMLHRRSTGSLVLFDPSKRQLQLYQSTQPESAPTLDDLQSMPLTPTPSVVASSAAESTSSFSYSEPASPSLAVTVRPSMRISTDAIESDQTAMPMPPFCAMCRRPFMSGFNAFAHNDGSPLSSAGSASARPSGVQSIYEEQSFTAPEYFELLTLSLEQEQRQQPQQQQRDSDTLSPSALNTGYYARFFRQERKLGSGAVGGVYLTHHVLDNITLGTYAVKIVPVGSSRTWLMSVLKEVRALEHVKSQYLINYSHCWLELAKPSDFGPEVCCLYILQQYANSGTLAQLVWPPQADVVSQRKAKRRKAATSNASGVASDSESDFTSYMIEDDIWHLFIEAALGLRALHRAGIIHRDLKLENCMLTRSSQGRLHLLIGDFGNAIFKNRPFQSTGNTGTLAYSSPETLRPGAAAQYTVASDLWALGVMLYAMSYAQLPFVSNDVDSLLAEQHKKSLSLPSQPVRSHELQLLIKQLLSLSPSNRPSLDAILTHPHVVQRRHYAPKVSIDSRGQSLSASRSDDLTCSSAPSSADSETLGIVQSPETGQTTPQSEAVNDHLLGPDVRLRARSMDAHRSIPQAQQQQQQLPQPQRHDNPPPQQQSKSQLYERRASLHSSADSHLLQHAMVLRQRIQQRQSSSAKPTAETLFKASDASNASVRPRSQESTALIHSPNSHLHQLRLLPPPELDSAAAWLNNTSSRLLPVLLPLAAASQFVVALGIATIGRATQLVGLSTSPLSGQEVSARHGTKAIRTVNVVRIVSFFLSSLDSRLKSIVQLPILMLCLVPLVLSTTSPPSAHFPLGARAMQTLANHLVVSILAIAISMLASLMRTVFSTTDNATVNHRFVCSLDTMCAVVQLILLLTHISQFAPHKPQTIPKQQQQRRQQQQEREASTASVPSPQQTRATSDRIRIIAPTPHSHSRADQSRIQRSATPVQTLVLYKHKPQSATGDQAHPND